MYRHNITFLLNLKKDHPTIYFNVYDDAWPLYQLQNLHLPVVKRDDDHTIPWYDDGNGGSSAFRNSLINKDRELVEPVL